MLCVIERCVCVLYLHHWYHVGLPALGVDAMINAPPEIILGFSLPGKHSHTCKTRRGEKVGNDILISLQKHAGNYTVGTMTLSPLQNVLFKLTEGQWMHDDSRFNSRHGYWRAHWRPSWRALCLQSELSASLHWHIVTLHKKKTKNTAVLPASQREAERANDTVP